ncbi:MAG: PhzF family phenazine biosynthesis protein [Actinomycetota bacterium]
MTTRPFAQIDAFTDTPFRGNPAAVLVLDGPADASWMQRVALEMHLSETAFVVPKADGSFDLRWFTPTVEVDLCGHATLAAAHLLHTEHQAPTPYHFDTRSGRLTATVANDGAITLDFPADPPTIVDQPAGLADALGAAPVTVARAVSDYLVELATADEVRALTLDQRLLATVEVPRGFVVTARSDRPGVDIMSRWFGPRAGVAEDPVTGSAHATLGPWWAPRIGSNRLVADQESARGGRIVIDVDGDRVRLTGRAVTVARGELLF